MVRPSVKAIMLASSPSRHALDDDLVPGVAELAPDHDAVDGLARLLEGAADDDALAGGQAVRLHHDGRADHVQVGLGAVDAVEDAELGGRDAVALHELLGEDLAAFQPRGLLGGAEDAQVSRPEGVHDAPASAGASGPTTVRSTAFWRANLRRLRMSPASTSTHSATCAMPALPGAQNSRSTRGD